MGEQTYGAELEIYGITTSQIRDAITGIDGATYAGHFSYHGSRRLGNRHARMDGTPIVWVSESDSSLRGHLPAEVISPILYGREGLAHLRRVMKALVRAGARVNSSCGTHLTMGVKNCSARFVRMGDAAKAKVAGRVYELYDYFWNGISELVSASRRNHSYCYRPSFRNGNRFGVAAKSHYLANLHRMCDRGAVNLYNFSGSGIIEFRMHNGTTNGNKFTTWALFNHKILSWCINSSPEDFRNYPPTLDGLMNMINVGSDLRTALVQRASQTATVQVTNRSYEIITIYEEYQDENGSGVVA